MDKTKHHFTFKERVMLKDLLELDSLKRKNGKPNISKIAKILHKNRNTIRREIKRLKDNEYDAKLAYEDYLQKRQKCFKKSSLLLNILEWLDEKYNKFHDSPEQICKKYEKEFGIKFPVCFKTLYKYIHLGFLNFKKDNLYFHGIKYKTKNRIDNRGKIRNFRTIEEAKHDKYEFGWFQMDTMVGKNNSVCLVLIEELTQFKIIEPLKEKTTKEVTNAVERIFSNRFFKDRCKGIITDQGKEFADWEKIEKITNAKVYFCDAGTPTQKSKVERAIRDFRHWFSKGIDLSIYSRNYYQEVANIINSKLKKSLHWLS
ncbi:IS30 family transposase [Spiroplasma endosymbiont of Polydrusus cervinus]|uniref:IS30 family transposase n=1 Tax=Spiroplasma endosymbiont of Polydrusus cervinus TaxID=3066287 RepID=UPI0030D5D5F2